MADDARGHGAHPAQARRALPGAGAEPEGVRGRARGGRRRDRRLRRGVRDVFAEEHQHARSPRASRASRRSMRARARARHPGARLRVVRARLPVRRRGRARGGRRTSRGRCYDMGCYEVSLGDTIGVGTPGKTRAMIEACRAARAGRQARRPLPRHLRPGARQHLCVARNGHGDVRQLGRRPRRLPVRARARPATSRPRTSCTCCTASASRPASTSTA